MLPCKHKVLLRLNPSNSSQQLPRRRFFTLSAHKSAFSCQVPKTQEPLWFLLEDEAGEADRERVQSDLFSLNGACGRPRPPTLTELTPPDPQKEGDAFQEFELHHRRKKIKDSLTTAIGNA